MTTKKLLLLAAAVAAVSAIPASAQGPYKYHAVTPCRLIDTRTCGGSNTAPICGGGPSFGKKDYAIQGKCGIPQGAAAVTVNATAVSPTQAGFLSMWPFGGSEPVVSTLNFVAGDTAIANGAIVPLATIVNVGDNDLSARLAVGPGNMFLVLDVTGYFSTN